MAHFLSEEELELLRDITILYGYYKELQLHADEISSESFLPPINEIKDSYDHLMRVFSVKFEIRDLSGNSDEYVTKNLDATFRHLYRAVFDYLDYISIHQKEIIHNRLDGISRDALTNIFPEYYQEILPEIDNCLDDIPRYKSEKDIGNPNLDNVEKYVQKVRQISEYFKTIDTKIPALNDYEMRRLSEEKKSEFKSVLLIVFGTILGIAICKFIGL